MTYTAIVLQAIARAIEELRRKYPLFCAHTLDSPRRRAFCVDEIRGAVLVHRVVDGEDYIFPAVVNNPHQMSLDLLSSSLREYTMKKVMEIPEFKRKLQVQKLPVLLQRWISFIARNMLPLRRRYYGTFALTTVGKVGPDLQLQPTLDLSFGFGSVRKRAVVVGDEVKSRLTMMLSVTFDRRFHNGVPTSELLVAVKNEIEILSESSQDENCLSSQDNESSERPPNISHVARC